MAVSIDWGSFFGCPYNKDHNILGSVLGPLISGGSHMGPNTGTILSRIGSVLGFGAVGPWSGLLLRGVHRDYTYACLYTYV